MLNALQAYQFDSNPVRVVMVAEEPWFVASDVAAVLGYSHTPNMVRILDDDEKGVHIANTLGGEQQLTIISESGLYAAIFKSRREEAQRFRRWVTGEVLPAIRKHGRYALFEPDPPQLPSPAADDVDVARLTAAIGVAREARQIWGREDCRQIWIKLGLPAPIADSEATTTDDFAGLVDRAVAGRDLVTLAEVAQLIGADYDAKLSLRLGQAMRLIGFAHVCERVDGRPKKLWRRIPKVWPAAEAAPAPAGEA